MLIGGVFCRYIVSGWIYIFLLSSLLGFIWIPLSLPFAWITWLMLAYMVKVSGFFASLPFSTVNISWFSGAVMVACYIIIAGWIIKENKKII